MNEFSLEKISERIHFGKSKEYFDEVLSSYSNGNYRSAVVMLWSVAVCDIVYKLQHLIDLYEDKAALSILNEVTAIQDNDPKSSAWEIKLIDETFDKTNLIDSAEYENLRYLQKQRHLSAHPVLNHNRDLHTPNKETVRSLLRNTLEGVLVKPPFYTQKILDELLEDISENSAALNSRKKVKLYVESRYLNRLTSGVELQLFKSLWKLVFKVENDVCNKNRLINLHVLEVLGKRNLGQLNQLILGEQDYFSNIAAGGNPIAYLVFYIAKNSQLYELLSDDAKIKISHCIDVDDVGKTLGWFVKTSLNTHYDDILNWIESDNPKFEEGQWTSLLEINDSDEWQTSFCKLVAAYYTCSVNFDQADNRFDQTIDPYLHLFNLDAIRFMLEKIEVKNQTYWRGRASIDHLKIKQRITDLNAVFDFTVYPNFSRTIEENN